jgi:hypothetical protein
MNLNVLHSRLLRDVLEIGNAFPLVITTTVTEGLTERGWQVEVIGVDTHGARMMATDPGSAEQCELDILRESFSRPPESTPWGPVLALDDVIGTKVRALEGRGLPRDLIDIHAASRLRTTTELEASADGTPGTSSPWRT